MSEIKKFICVSCPLGCGLSVSLDDSGEVLKVEGNSCPRGASYAKSEVKDPRRVFASTVRVSVQSEAKLQLLKKNYLI